MKEIHFNIPIERNKYSNNVKKLLNKKLSLHGPEENVFKIKKKLKTLLGFKHTHLTNSCTSAMEMSVIGAKNVANIIIAKHHGKKINSNDENENLMHSHGDL